MMLKNDWLWDRKITVNKARSILKNPQDKHFLSLAGALLSRKNTPKEVLRHYLKPLDFVRNWQRIKKQMRKDDWNDPRIEYWQAIYETVRDRYRKRGLYSTVKEAPAAKKEEEFCKAAATKIKIARKIKGLTQNELADRLKISQQAISRIENGRENISLGTLKRIADALGATIDLTIYTA